MTDTTPTPTPGPAPAAADPTKLLKSRSYLALLVLGAVIGVPVATVAYFFLDAMERCRTRSSTIFQGSSGSMGSPGGGLSPG